MQKRFPIRAFWYLMQDDRGHRGHPILNFSFGQSNIESAVVQKGRWGTCLNSIQSSRRIDWKKSKVITTEKIENNERLEKASNPKNLS